MKLLLAVLLSAAAPAAWGNCNPNSDAPGTSDKKSCSTNSGQCSLAADLFLGAPEQSAGVALSAAPSVLQYGKFCGGGNKCPGLNNANEKADGRDIDVDACEDNVIDGFCKGHDACLDNAGGPGSEGVPAPERCPCELALVAKLAVTALGDLDARVPGVPLGQLRDAINLVESFPGVLDAFQPPEAELCDDDFYDAASPLGPITYAEFLSLPVPQTPYTLSRSPEAVLIAAAFCGQFVSPAITGNEESGQCLLDPEEYLALGYDPVFGIPDIDLGIAKGLCASSSLPCLREEKSARRLLEEQHP